MKREEVKSLGVVITITVAVIVGIISSIFTAKIITARYIELLSDYENKSLEQTKELINFVKVSFVVREKDKCR